MTKEQLRQYRDLEKEIKQLEEYIRKLESDICTVKSVLLDGMPKQSGISDPMKVVDKLADTKLLYEKKWDVLIDMRLEIERAIDCLPSLERKLIRHYYFEGLTWGSVCCEIGYAWRQTHRLHADALKKLKDGTQWHTII